MCCGRFRRFSLFRRDQQPGRAADDAGRVAARDRPERPEPHARAARRRAVQRSVRRLGLLDPRAARQRRSHRDHRGHGVEPVRQLRHGRRHQHRDQPADAAHRRAQAAIRQPHQPEVRLLRQRSVEARSAPRSKAASSTPTAFPIVAATERGPIDNNAERQVPQRHRQARIRPDRPPSTRSSAPVTSPRIASTARSAKSTTPTGPASAAASARAARPEHLQAHVFVDDRDSHFNFLAVTNAATTRNVVRLATDQRVPTNGVGGMVQWTKVFGTQAASSAPAPTALGRRRQPGRRLRRRRCRPRSSA